MTAPPATLTTPLTIPPTQNTAPVYEHRCLYTHDLRRKQKRWQDGFVKYHTFNKRVMVYDVPRNYIGDMHASEELQDGDEVTLERGGVLVQVGERVGRAETDLTSVVAQRKERTYESGNTASTARTGMGQLQPRSSNVPPRTPSRWIGWAGRAVVPQQSPFEARQVANPRHLEETSRPAKRQRRAEDDHIPLFEILKTSRAPRPKPPQTPVVAAPMPLRLPTKVPTKPKNKDSTKKAQPPSQGRLNVKEIIDISSSVDDNPIERRAVEDSRPASSQITVEGQLSPAAISGRNTASAIPLQQQKPNKLQCDSPPAPAVQWLRLCPLPEQDPKPNELEKIPIAPSRSEKPSGFNDRQLKPSIVVSLPQPSSPPVSTTNHLPSIEPPLKTFTTDLDPPEARPQIENQAQSKPLKPLRIAARAPRRTLLCEDEADPPPQVPGISAPLGPQDDFTPIESVVPSPPRKRNQRGKSPQIQTAAKSDSDSNTGDGDDVGSILHSTGPFVDDNNNIAVDRPALSRLSPAETVAKSDEILQPSREPLQAIDTLPNQVTTTAVITAAQPATLRRHATTTAASGGTMQNPPFQQARFKQPLRRVETHPVITTTAKAGVMNRQKNTTVQVNGTTNVEAQNRDQGPWSKEAWDLFGWCPESKTEALGWCYA